MTRGLLISTAASRRLGACAEWLSERTGSGILVVSPTRGAADDLLRRVTESGTDLHDVHRLTVRQLATEIAIRPMAETRRTPIGDLGLEALAARSIAILQGAGELACFAPVADAPGLARALARTIRELRAHEIEPDDLATRSGKNGEAARDLGLLLATYLRELGHEREDGCSRADEALVFQLAGTQIVRGHRFAGLPLLLLDPSLPSPVERRFLQALVSAAPLVLATVVAGDDDARGAFEELLGTGAEDLDRDVAAAGKLERLRRRVFRPEDDGAGDESVAGEDEAGEDDAGEDDESVVVFAAPGESRECVEIARRIRGRAQDGVPFDRVAILLRDPEAYLSLVEEALRRAEIPAYFSRGTTRPHPSGRAFLALLNCRAERYSASRFAEYLSLGQVPVLDEAGAPPAVVEVPWVEPEGDQLVFKALLPVVPAAGAAPAVPAGVPGTAPEDEPSPEGTLRTPRRWEELIVDAAVVGGRERWKRRLDGLAAELRLRRQKLGDDEESQRERLDRQLRQLVDLERFALPVIDALAELPGEAPWGDWLEALGGLATLALRRPERVLGVLNELAPMGPVGPVSLDEVLRVLGERLTVLRREPPDRRYGRVFVATVSEGRGRSFDTAFLPGLAEGIFPRRAVEDPLLLDAERRRLGRDLPTQEQRVARERLLLRLAAGTAARRLVVSYPNLDPYQGRSRVPSFYALDVLRAAEGRLPEVRQLETEAAARSASILGWPAPRQPETAIDDAEYDLSTLEPLLRLPPQEARGRGRFLLENNEALGRSLRSRYLRWRWKSGFTWADGVVAPDAATREALGTQRLAGRSYSPTALQAYAACPYKFLLYAIHRLRPRDEIVSLEQLDPLTRGSLFHEVQFELLGQLRQEGLLPMRSDHQDRLFELADATLDRIAEGYAEELAPAIPKVWASEIEGLRSDLRGWILAVVAAAEPWRPAWFELSFGLPLAEGHDPASRRAEVVVLDGFRLRGSIDVVEVDDEAGTLRVTDHKTGRAIRGRSLEVGGGETLQPLLYALVAEQLLDRPVAEGRLFYCTRRGGYQDVTVPLSDDTRTHIRTVLELIDRAVDSGFLPAAPRKDACRWCDYRTVCGPFEEMRIGRKRQEQLVALSGLRKMA